MDCGLVTGGASDEADNTEDELNVVVSKEYEAPLLVTLHVALHWSTLIKLLSLP